MIESSKQTKQENEMKNYTTPRNYADCTWVQGYAISKPEPLWERVAGYVLAFAIGAGMAVLLVVELCK